MLLYVYQKNWFGKYATKAIRNVAAIEVFENQPIHLPTSPPYTPEFSVEGIVEEIQGPDIVIRRIGNESMSIAAKIEKGKTTSEQREVTSDRRGSVDILAVFFGPAPPE